MAETLVLTSPTAAPRKSRGPERIVGLAYKCPVCALDCHLILDGRQFCEDRRFKWPYARKRCCHAGEIVEGVQVEKHSHRRAPTETAEEAR